MGKVEIGIYFCVTADILTIVLLKCLWSSPLPTIWILSKSLILIGGHGNRKAKFSRKKKKKKQKNKKTTTKKQKKNKQNKKKNNKKKQQQKNKKKKQKKTKKKTTFKNGNIPWVVL